MVAFELPGACATLVEGLLHIFSAFRDSLATSMVLSAGLDRLCPSIHDEDAGSSMRSSFSTSQHSGQPEVGEVMPRTKVKTTRLLDIQRASRETHVLDAQS